MRRMSARTKKVTTNYNDKNNSNNSNNNKINNNVDLAITSLVPVDAEVEEADVVDSETMMNYAENECTDEKGNNKL